MPLTIAIYSMLRRIGRFFIKQKPKRNSEIINKLTVDEIPQIETIQIFCPCLKLWHCYNNYIGREN